MAVGADGGLTEAPNILVVTEGSDGAIAAERVALGAAGGVAARSNWRGAVAKVANLPVLKGIYADARGLASEPISTVLAAIIALSDARLVVEFDCEQLDAVAGVLLATDAVLLCEATDAERAVAVASLAIGDRMMVHDDTHAARRYEQINAEVARFAETLARLTRDDPVGANPPSPSPYVAERMIGFGAQPVERDVDPALIRRAIRARRLRDDAFDRPGLFEDPAWDMLLDLFAAELERRQVSVSSLCIAAAVAPTTALRWIGRLADAGLIERRPDEFDRRRAYISLSARASTAMRNYLRALDRAGLAIA